MNERSARAALLLGGAALPVAQFLALRTAPGLKSEVVLSLVAAFSFAGISLGARLGGSLAPRTLARLALLSWALQLTLPFLPRALAGALAAHGRPEAGFALGAALAAAGGTWYAAALLPWLARGREASAFGRGYALELGGALLGFGATGLLPPRPDAAPLLLLALSAAVALLAAPGAARAALLAGGTLAYAALFPRLEAASLAAFYRGAAGLEVSAVPFSANTLYQRVDIVEGGGARYLFLDGFVHYLPDADRFNLAVAGLPASLSRPAEALVVGSGSYGAARAALAAGSARVVSLDIDAVAARAGLDHLAPGRAPEGDPRWTLEIDDAWRRVRAPGPALDLLALDVAGPFQRQVARLYSVEFFRAARGRLRPGGTLSLGLFGDLSKGEPVPAAVAAGLLEAFPQVYALVPLEPELVSLRGFALAGERLPYGRRGIESGLRALGLRYRVLERPELEALVAKAGAVPLSRRGLAPVLGAGASILRRGLALSPPLARERAP